LYMPHYSKTERNGVVTSQESKLTGVPLPP
jgi:hypothetical protein